MNCTCESLRIDVHPLDSLLCLSNSQDEVNLIGTVCLGSGGRGNEDGLEQKKVATWM